MELHQASITEETLGSTFGGRSSIKLTIAEESLTKEEISAIHEAVKEDFLNIGREIRAKIIKAGIAITSIFKAKEPGEILHRNFGVEKAKKESPYTKQTPTTYVDFRKKHVIQ